MAENCNHRCCDCEVPDTRSDGYCSDECLQLGPGDEHECPQCPCGHPGCDASTRVE